MTLAPIVLFVYNRLYHTKKTVEALQKNELSQQSDLIIFSDGPKNSKQEPTVQAVRQYVHSITGFQSVKVIERSNNFGLANNIIDGVTDIVNRFGSIIVLEDDLETSPYFLRYMNDGLNRYQAEDSVACIHGYTYPVHHELPETFFLRGADCWGWATWKRGWDLFEIDGRKLLAALTTQELTREFDYDDNYPFTKMLSDQIEGRNDSWAIRWQASAFIKAKLTLYPGRSLVRNIGNDGSGVHSGSSTIYDVQLSDSPVVPGNIPVEVSNVGRAAFVEYFHSIKPGFLTRMYQNVKLIAKNVIHR